MNAWIAFWLYALIFCKLYFLPIVRAIRVTKLGGLAACNLLLLPTCTVLVLARVPVIVRLPPPSEFPMSTSSTPALEIGTATCRERMKPWEKALVLMLMMKFVCLIDVMLDHQILQSSGHNSKTVK